MSKGKDGKNLNHLKILKGFEAKSGDTGKK